MKILTIFMFAWPIVSILIAVGAAIIGYWDVTVIAALALAAWVAATWLHLATRRK